VAKSLREGGKSQDIMKAVFRPDMMKLGAIRSVYDGRYKISRYFSPKQHNGPTIISGGNLERTPKTKFAVVRLLPLPSTVSSRGYAQS